MSIDTKCIDFKVRTEDLYTKSGIHTDKMAIVKEQTNEVLGVVSQKYNVVEHMSAFNAGFDAMRKIGGFTLDKLETSENGARMYATFLGQKRTFQVQKGDIVQPMFTMQNSLDGFIKLGFSLGGKRLVCLNGMTAPVSMMNISVKHTASVEIEEVMEQARASITVFSNDVMPMWEAMTRVNEAPDKMIGIFLKERAIVPVGITESVWKTVVNENRAMKDISVWDLYNHYTKVITHEYDGNFERKLGIGLHVSKIIKNQIMR